MALSPHKFREIVLQILYSQEMAKPEEKFMTDLMMAELEVSKKNIKLAQEKVNAIYELLPQIDQMITSVSSSYEFDRIQIVIKNILRIGVYELFFDESIPCKVAIAESIRLARKFSTPESSAFVNALLDHLYQKSQGIQVDPKHFSLQMESFKENENVSENLIKERIAHKENTPANDEES